MPDFEYMAAGEEQQSTTLKLPNASREYVNITPFTGSRSSSRNPQPRRHLGWCFLVLGVLGFLWVLVFLFSIYNLVVDRKYGPYFQYSPPGWTLHSGLRSAAFLPIMRQYINIPLSSLIFRSTMNDNSLSSGPVNRTTHCGSKSSG